MPDSFFSSPFLLHGALTGPFQLSIFGAPAGGDQHGIYPGSQEQMLQNVACSRFGPALIAMKSQDSNVRTWDDNAEEREGKELDNQVSVPFHRHSSWKQTEWGMQSGKPDVLHKELYNPC